MVAWQSGYQDAEREYQNMNEQILQEVSLPAPAVRPEGSVNPPPVSIPPVSTSQFTVPSAENVPQSSGQSSGQAVGQSMDEDIQARWAKVSALRKSYPGAPPPANWGSMGFNVTTPMTQAAQAQIPQFFNFIGSSSGVSQAAIQAPASVEGNTTLFNLPKTVGFPPELLEVYGRQMRKVRGPVESQPTVEETETSTQEEEQYSGTEISPEEAARIGLKFNR